MLFFRWVQITIIWILIALNLLRWAFNRAQVKSDATPFNFGSLFSQLDLLVSKWSEIRTQRPTSNGTLISKNNFLSRHVRKETQLNPFKPCLKSVLWVSMRTKHNMLLILFYTFVSCKTVIINRYSFRFQYINNFRQICLRTFYHMLCNYQHHLIYDVLPL
jgi:hypothetical protein